MKNYTVKEISKMLNTSEETVRRWIRSEKLPATWSAKKTGNLISEENLNSFLRLYPKYQKIAISSTIAGLVVGGIMLSSSVIKEYISKKKDYAPSEMRRVIERKCYELKETIKEKEKEKNKLDNEINELREQIKQYEDCMKSINNNQK